MMAGMLALFALYEILKKNKNVPQIKPQINKLKCPRCKEYKRINALEDKENTYWCAKCGYEFVGMPQVTQTTIQVPEPPKQQNICYVCSKEFESELKLRRHFGHTHFDKIDLK